MPSLFTKIVNREIPAHIVAEDDKFLAFLDIRPIVIGHTLVIPKEEISYIFSMEDELLAELTIFAKKVAWTLQAVTNTRRVGMAVSGFEIPHVHYHLCPINDTKEMSVTNPPIPMTDEQLLQLATKIREVHVQLNGSTPI